MAEKYGYNISGPAKNSKEAVQWLYFGYLAAIKENNGAAMSLGRVDAFLDIVINDYETFKNLLNLAYERIETINAKNAKLKEQIKEYIIIPTYGNNVNIFLLGSTR